MQIDLPDYCIEMFRSLLLKKNLFDHNQDKPWDNKISDDNISICKSNIKSFVEKSVNIGGSYQNSI